MIREELRDFDFRNYVRTNLPFWEEPLTAEELRHIMERPEFDVFWQHDGDMTRPHAELTSGKCSNGYVDCRPLLERTDLCQIFASQIVTKLMRSGWSEIMTEVTWVVSSAYAAIPLGKDVANMLGANFGCTQKAGPDGKEQVWNGSSIGPEELVLQIEDLNTTGGTIQAVRKGLRDACGNVRFAKKVGLLVDRSGQTEVDGSQLVWIAHYDIQNVDPGDCLLCRAGSQRLRPKKPASNWALLKGRE